MSEGIDDQLIAPPVIPSSVHCLSVIPVRDSAPTTVTRLDRWIVCCCLGTRYLGRLHSPLLFFFFFYCHCEVSVRRTDEEARKKRIAFFLCLSLCRTSGKEAQGLYKHVHSVYSETDVTNQSKKIKKHTTSTFNPPPPPPFPFSTEGTPELTT